MPHFEAVAKAYFAIQILGLPARPKARDFKNVVHRL